MITISKKYRSPDQLVTLITVWATAIGAILLQLCSLSMKHPDVLSTTYLYLQPFAR